MNLPDYQRHAVRTESLVPAVSGVSAKSLHLTMRAVAAVGEIADQIKKHVFYSRPYNREALNESIFAAVECLEILRTTIQPGTATFGDSTESAEYLGYTDPRFEAEAETVVLDSSSLDAIPPRIFHAAIGTITEAAEIAEALVKALENKQLDTVNLAEEFGDVNWYINGIFPDASGIPAGQILDTNIGKLVKRYPEKFDGLLAQQENRDLEAEHKILEAGVNGYGPQTEKEIAAINADDSIYFQRGGANDLDFVKARLIGKESILPLVREVAFNITTGRFHPSNPIPGIEVKNDKDGNVEAVFVHKHHSLTGEDFIASAGSYLVATCLTAEYFVMSKDEFESAYAKRD